MESRKVRVECLVIGKEQFKAIINVPKHYTDEEAIALGHDFIRKQFPKAYAKGSVIEEKVTLVEEPKKEKVLTSEEAKEDALREAREIPKALKKALKQQKRDR